ncbi:MAG: hypothetical protein ACREXR_10430 [Gammaproteobacteria bacterium]
MSKLAVVFLASLCISGCASLTTVNQDLWAVRRVTSAGTAYVDTLSNINSQKKVRPEAVTEILVAERTMGDAKITLQCDIDIEMSWMQARRDVEGELGIALRWLQKLSESTKSGAEIIITIVDGSKRIRTIKRHPSENAAVVDIYIPSNLRPSQTQSAMLRNALATSLHEVVHAFSSPAGPGRDRLKEEFQATLFETCYLIDSIRPGDVLHLSAGTGRKHGGPYTLRQSEKAVMTVMKELTRIAGSDSVAASDGQSVHALKAFCSSATFR